MTMTPIGKRAFGLVSGLRAGCLSPSWEHFLSSLLATLVFNSNLSRAGELAIEERSLPPLRIQGQPACAHTQGMELVAGKYFVTARRDDVRPKRALLLRHDPAGTDWDVWDITPVAQGELAILDHPGGMQSDGTRLWIPLAESNRNGRSLVRAFGLDDMKVGQPLESAIEFSVDDHIGALAVSTERRLVFGANWNTEKVYIWDFTGHLQKTFSSVELKVRGLGAVAGLEGRSGIAVQDWKFVGDRLFASGLFRSPGSTTETPESRLIWFTDLLETDFQRRSVTLPLRNGNQLAREGMAISDGLVHLLPEDLGVTNRMFRVSVADLMKRAVVEPSRSSDAP